MFEVCSAAGLFECPSFSSDDVLELPATDPYVFSEEYAAAVVGAAEAARVASAAGEDVLQRAPVILKPPGTAGPAPSPPMTAPVPGSTHGSHRGPGSAVLVMPASGAPALFSGSKKRRIMVRAVSAVLHCWMR
jgi:hypothetical protein